mmetsp:Transcript_11455/g.27480  ORF Transcript_11455/g.27480 Transcript_11455/m.27480 type:complete len:123 (-) Transcript_11455:8-376(-)
MGCVIDVKAKQCYVHVYAGAPVTAPDWVWLAALYAVHCHHVVEPGSYFGSAQSIAYRSGMSRTAGNIGDCKALCMRLCIGAEYEKENSTSRFGPVTVLLSGGYANVSPSPSPGCTKPTSRTS